MGTDQKFSDDWGDEETLPGVEPIGAELVANDDPTEPGAVWAARAYPADFTPAKTARNDHKSTLVEIPVVGARL